MRFCCDTLYTLAIAAAAVLFAQVGDVLSTGRESQKKRENTLFDSLTTYV